MSRRLRAVVYGLFDRYEGFVLLDPHTAGAIVEDISALAGAQTLGDLREIDPRLEHIDGPVHPEDEEWVGLPDETPVDLYMYENWPPFPAYFQVPLPTEVLDELDAAGCIDYWAPMMDAEFYVIRASHEEAMLAVLGRHGISAARDDALIFGLGE